MRHQPPASGWDLLSTWRKIEGRQICSVEASSSVKETETVMQGNVATQVEREELIIRHAPRPRPRSPRRATWQGPLPLGVKAIVERAALDQHFSKLYAKWASGFALLTDAFIVETVTRANLDPARLPGWTCFKWVDSCCCKVDDNYLWVQNHDSGWTVELCYPDATDPDSFVLTIENMPVLCHDRRSAVSLALACYPAVPVNLAWDPYW
jgi:hypothetical protein